MQANDAQYRAGKGSVDLLLRAQISLATAEKAYYQSLVGYNRAILDMKYRKGTLMEDNSVFLSESLSHPEAYSQAVRHAWARSHAIDANDLLETQPEEFVSDESDPVELGTAVWISALTPLRDHRFKRLTRAHRIVQITLRMLSSLDFGRSTTFKI